MYKPSYSKLFSAADKTEEKICEKAASCYGRSEGIDNAVLVLWKKPDPGVFSLITETPAKKPKTSQAAQFEIPIVKEFLMMSSPVFRTMFTGSFKEASTCRVELPGKSINAVLDMLDHLYSTRKLVLDDQKAAALLPLAHEYQIEKLKDLCVCELKKFVKPRLEYVSLAERFEHEEFLSEAIDMCAKHLSLNDIDHQKLEPMNKGFNDSILLKILRRKTVMAGNFVTKALIESVDTISRGHTPKITTCRVSRRFPSSNGNQVKYSIEYTIEKEYNSTSTCSKPDCASEKARRKSKTDLKELLEKFNSDCPKF